MSIPDKAKIEAAIKMLQEQGHSVQTQMREQKNTVWFEIDRRMLPSWEEMENLVDGVYSLEELEDLYRRRQAGDQGKLTPVLRSKTEAAPVKLDAASLSNARLRSLFKSVQLWSGTKAPTS